MTFASRQVSRWSFVTKMLQTCPKAFPYDFDETSDMRAVEISISFCASGVTTLSKLRPNLLSDLAGTESECVTFYE
jgi:hypothetical protein